MTGKSTEAGHEKRECPQCGLDLRVTKQAEHTAGAASRPLGQLYRKPRLVMQAQSQTLPPAAA
jgi:hypothetical protein